jgi:hypothetical protein
MEVMMDRLLRKLADEMAGSETLSAEHKFLFKVFSSTTGEVLVTIALASALIKHDRHDDARELLEAILRNYGIRA